MKTRNGFVSNSSTSSFICDIMRKSYSSTSGGRIDDECNCPKGHAFKERYLIPIPAEQIKPCKAASMTVEQMRRQLLRSFSGIRDDIYKVAYKNGTDEQIREWHKNSRPDMYATEEDEKEHVSSARCPICTFQYGKCEDMLLYLADKLGLTEQDVVDEMKSKFKKYDAVYKHLNTTNFWKDRT